MFNIRKSAIPCVFAAAALALAGSGCRWMQKKPEFEGQEVGKPLVIPPGMNKPSTRDALNIPPKSMIGANVPKAPATRSLEVDGDVPTVWRKVGAALAGFPDVEVTATAESIATYEVVFSQETFLISVQASGAKSRVVAVGIDGSASDSIAAASLVARLKPLL